MLPTLTVLLDDGTGTFPADISRWVLADGGYSITRGREDWQGAVTAGQLDLTLDNSTGLFTPGFVGGFGVGPFGGGGFVDQRIRVKETVNGVTYTRFTGYVKAWPVAWPATVSTFATVRLTATDAQARAERRPLSSVMIEEMLVDAPAAYYTLGEDEGSTSAGDTSGNQRPPLAMTGGSTALQFGATAGAVVDGLTCVQFNAGNYLKGAAGTTPWIAAGSTFTLECYFATTNTTTGTSALVYLDDGTGLTNGTVSLAINSAGNVTANSASILMDAFPAVVANDGLIHHLAMTLTSGNLLTLYLDGVVVNSTTSASAVIPRPLVNLSIEPSGSKINSSGSLTGSISHVAVNASALSSTRIGVHASARAAFTGESGTARLTRLAGYAGVPTGTMDTSLTNLSAATGWDGSTPAAEIQKVSDTEMGLTYIDGTGSLVFHNRNRVVTKTAPDLILSSQWVTPEVTPILDDQQIINYMEVTSAGTGSTALVRSTTSETTHGRYPGSQSYLVQTDDEGRDRANWTVADFAEPTPRYGTLTVNLFGMSAVQAGLVIAALDLDCWLRVTSMAPQNPGGTIADVIVQGFTATATGDTWAISCNVVSRSLYAAFILDDATYGVLDSPTARIYV